MTKTETQKERRLKEFEEAKRLQNAAQEAQEQAKEAEEALKETQAQAEEAEKALKKAQVKAEKAGEQADRAKTKEKIEAGELIKNAEKKITETGKKLIETVIKTLNQTIPNSNTDEYNQFHNAFSYKIGTVFTLMMVCNGDKVCADTADKALAKTLTHNLFLAFHPNTNITKVIENQYDLNNNSTDKPHINQLFETAINEAFSQQFKDTNTFADFLGEHISGLDYVSFNMTFINTTLNNYIE